MAIPFLALAQIGMAGYNMYQQHKGFNDQIRALNKMKRRSPAELQYYNDLRNRSARGDINVSQQMSRRTPGIQAVHQQSQQSAMGSLYGSGLENSVIADELRRKTQKTTLQQMQQESQALADRNQATIQQAHKEMGEYGQRRSELLNKISMQSDQLRSQRDQALMSGAMQMGVSAIGGITAGAQGGGTLLENIGTGLEGMAFGSQIKGSGGQMYNIPGVGGGQITPVGGGNMNVQKALASGQLYFKDGQYWMLGPGPDPVPIGTKIPSNFFGGQ